MNNNSLTIAAITVLAALLATGAVISSEIAFAGGHHYSKSVRQTVAQDNYCGSGTMPLDVNCQNLGSQVKGSHNAVNVISVQPSSSGVDHGNDHKDDGSNHDDHGNNQGSSQGGNGGSPNGGNPSGNQGSSQGGNGGSANGGNPSGNHAGSSQGGNHAGSSQGNIHAGSNPVGNPSIGAGA
jgi:hypothetical protein